MPYLHTHFEWKTLQCNVSSSTQIHSRHSLTYEISTYLATLLRCFKKVEEKEITFLKREPNFSFRCWKRNEKKVVEEYCWAITQAERRSRCSRSGSSALEHGYHLDSLLYACTVDPTYTEFRLAPDLPKLLRKSGSVCTRTTQPTISRAVL
jgi:hypothetical protein